MLRVRREQEVLQCLQAGIDVGDLRRLAEVAFMGVSTARVTTQRRGMLLLVVIRVVVVRGCLLVVVVIRVVVVRGCLLRSEIDGAAWRRTAVAAERVGH